MNIEICSNDDENFRFVSENDVKEVREPEVIEDVVDVNDIVIQEPEDVKFVIHTGKQKIPAPLENPKGLGWFDGTSWGTN